MSEEKNATRIKSLEKSLLILETLAGKGPELSLTELSEITKFNISSIHHILNTLKAWCYIEQNEATSKYRLGARMLTLGIAVYHNLNFREEALPVMKRISEHSKWTAALMVKNRDEVVCVESVEGNTQLRVVARVGMHHPLHCTAPGKLFLSELAPSGIIDYAKRTSLPAFTPNTIVDPACLIQEVERVRELGYAVDNEESWIGGRYVSLPVQDFTGKIIACISLTGPNLDFGAESFNKNFEYACKEVQGLSAKFGYGSNS